MIEKTKMKLEEARFFHRRLIECRKQPLSLESNAFQFYLSAFMQAARTVPWRLQIEEKQKYLAWLPTWEGQVTAEETALLKFTNERRIDEVHRGGIETIAELEDIDIHDLLKSSPIHSYIFDVNNPAYDTTMPPGTRTSSVSVTIPAFYFDREGVKENVIETCKKYLDYLERLVQEFMRVHADTESKTSA
jgi:hypothetical protein